MKKISLLLITAIVMSFTAQSQITLKKLELIGDMAVLKTDAGAQYLNIKPITHYWIEYTPTDTIIMISGNNKQFSFAIRTQNEFIVNGTVKPISVASYIAELDGIIAAASSGGGATAALQQATIDSIAKTNAAIRLQDSTTQSRKGVVILNHATILAADSVKFRKVVSIDNLTGLSTAILQQKEIEALKAKIK